jgi:GGDEF domain-containing protein
LNMITGRLQAAFLDYVRDHQLKYGFSLSIGVAHFDPASDSGLEQLVRQADEALYADKRR